MMPDPIPSGEPMVPPPHNVEAEAALLGALMIDNRLVDAIADKLHADHFFEPLHGRIFTAIVRQVANGAQANPVSLRPFFANDPAIAEVGGPGYLAQLTGSGAAVIGARDFAKQIVALAQLRALIAVAEGIATRARNTADGLDFEAQLGEAESELAALTRDDSDGLVEVSAGEAAALAIAAGENPELMGVLSGIEPIDEAIGPLYRKDLTIVGARPGMGKSVLASEYAIGAAQRGHGVLFVSLEMTKEQLGVRMLSSMTFNLDGRGVPYELIQSGQLDMKQARRVAWAKDELDKLPIQIADAGRATTAKLNALIRRWKRRFEARGQKLELVIVDYLQKLWPDLKTKDLYERITQVAQDGKTAAKVNDVAVMALAQLSRALESRQDKRPVLSDLRDSGQIEQEADTVLFLFRPEYYLAATEPARSDDDAARQKWERSMEIARHRMEFICGKRRMGGTKKTFGRFHGAFSAIRSNDA